MTQTDFVTRRATVEDLPELLTLWQLERLPAAALEKRFTEFQVVTDETGQIVAAIGLQIAGTQGLLHSEAMAKQEMADALRERLWKRIHVIIQNHALERLWTQMNTLYWRDRGFALASAEQAALRPAAFGPGEGEWHMMTLRAADANAAVDRELAQFKTLQQNEAARLQEWVRWMKRVALGLTILVFVLVVVAVALFKYGSKVVHGH